MRLSRLLHPSVDGVAATLLTPLSDSCGADR
jgi:hypothetical protein